jgi:cytochrome c-type biogenesis protein CcmH/NrfG
MSRSSGTHDPARQAERFGQELLASLGLGPGASNEEIETAHDAVVRFLDDAPAAIRRWAAAQEAAADESYALLRGSRADLIAAAVARTAGSNAPAAPAPVHRDRAGAATVASPDADDGPDEFDQEAPRVRHARRDASAPAPANRRGRALRRLALAAAAGAAVVVVAVVGYSFGAPSVPGFNGTPAPESSSAVVDKAQVAALMQKLATNPSDIPTLQQLGDLYYAAGDYATAATWMDKVLAIDPKNVTGLLALGAAQFNVGQLDAGETAWRKVLAIDPQNVEAHYDLGFMYLSKNPPDLVNVRKEWNEVIAIAPDSDVAKTVATHLTSLDGSPAPSTGSGSSAGPSAGAGVTPAPSGAASPALSAQPSAPSTTAPNATPRPSASGR